MPTLNLSDGPRIAVPVLSMPPPRKAVPASLRATSPSLRSHAPPAIQTTDPLIGKLIADRYVIKKRIGRGAMGVVYEVEHSAIGKHLAMKVLSSDIALCRDAGARFEREALAASRLQSPNTVQVCDYGVSEGIVYLVMELVQGEPLSHVLRREGPMAPRRLAKIAIQICSSLAEAHEKGVVHRDIKPDNVMLIKAADGSDIVKVLDFGLAKLRELDGSSQVTSHGMVLGTPHYMAPEQIRGEAVDGLTDVYSVGALMYVALTGHHPFDGKPTDVLVSHLSAAPQPPMKRFPELNIDAGMNAIVMQSLRKDPKARPKGAAGLQSLLVEELRGAGSSSVERLLDPQCLSRIAAPTPPPRASQPQLASTKVVATSVPIEVDVYERGLRRKGQGWKLGLGVVGVAAGLATTLAMTRVPAFEGVEAEPNNVPAAANELPFGAEVEGNLGRRIDADTPDRDFYLVDVPSMGGTIASVGIRLTGLPNVGVCVAIYEQGIAAPKERWCSGGPGRDVSSPSLEVEPGRYLLEVSQERPTGSKVQENVSDPYRLWIEAAE